MSECLIVGGSSVAGQASLAAVRRVHPAWKIAATSSKAADVPGADITIPGIDLFEPGARAKIPDQKGIRLLVFTPAFGPIGYPVAGATPEDVAKAVLFSVAPMEELAARMLPEKVIGFSAFYWLRHTLAAYGSMAYAKIAQEKLAVDRSEFHMVRAGTFESKATRGIGLLLQRALRDTPHAEIRALGDAWRESGKKFGEFFMDFAFESERMQLGSLFESPHRPTNAQDLENAVVRILSGEGAPIVNVIGDWQWVDAALPRLPAAFKLPVR